MFTCTLRREQTLSRVGEHFAAYHPINGWTFPGGAPGWSEAARIHLDEFLEAGLIDAGNPHDGSLVVLCDGSRVVRLTTAGKYLLRRWLHGPAEVVVELPPNEPDLEIEAAGVPTEVGYRSCPLRIVADDGTRVSVLVFAGTEPRAGIEDPETYDGDGSPWQSVYGTVVTVQGVPQAVLRADREGAARLGAALIAAAL